MAWTCPACHSPSPFSAPPSPLILQNCAVSSLRLQRQRLLKSNPSGFLSFGITVFRISKTPPRLRVPCLSDSKAMVVTGKSWDKLVLNSDIPVLVEFYASWCGPCRKVHRVIDKIAMDYSGKLKCFVLNADEDVEVAEDYEIKAVPVVLLFKNGEKRESVIGAMPKEFYVSAIERVISS